jgi:hypothetical protein
MFLGKLQAMDENRVGFAEQAYSVERKDRASADTPSSKKNRQLREIWELKSSGTGSFNFRFSEGVE